MSTLTIRLPDDKHERLKALAEIEFHQRQPADGRAGHGCIGQLRRPLTLGDSSGSGQSRARHRLARQTGSGELTRPTGSPTLPFGIRVGNRWSRGRALPCPRKKRSLSGFRPIAALRPSERSSKPCIRRAQPPRRRCTRAERAAVAARPGCASACAPARCLDGMCDLPGRSLEPQQATSDAWRSGGPSAIPTPLLTSRTIASSSSTSQTSCTLRCADRRKRSTCRPPNELRS